MVWPIASIDGHNITAYYLQVSESRSSDGACGPPRPPSIRVGSLQEGLLTDSSTQTQISEVALPLNSRASEWEVRSSVKRSLFMRTPKLLGGRSIRDNSQFEWHQDGGGPIAPDTRFRLGTGLGVGRSRRNPGNPSSWPVGANWGFSSPLAMWRCLSWRLVNKPHW